MATTILKVTCQGQIYRLHLEPEPEFSVVSETVRELCPDGKEGSVSFTGAGGAPCCLTEHSFEEFLSTARLGPTGRPMLRLELQPPQAVGPVGNGAVEEIHRDVNGLQETSGDEPLPPSDAQPLGREDISDSKKLPRKRGGQKRGKGALRRAADKETSEAKQQVGDGTSGDESLREDVAAEGRDHGTNEVEGLDAGYAKELSAASRDERKIRGVDMDLGSILKQQTEMEGPGARRHAKPAESETKQDAARVPLLRLPGIAQTRAGNDDARQMPQGAGEAEHTEEAVEDQQQPAMLWPDTPESSPRGHYRQPQPQPLFWMPVPIMMPVMAC